MPTELISLIAGSATGFIFRYMAEKRQSEAENFKRLLDANKQTTDNQDKAVQRVSVDAGKAVRQIIVLMVLFGTIAAPFVLPFFGIPTIVEVTQTNPEVLFGLIPETKETIFQTVNGYLFTQENRQILVSIVGFYFGSAAAGNKS
ncbi:MAG: hypothetical protein RLZ10_1657 [Bacteroidota bacterium]|jgi:hypothetical protein